ncbi:MAG: hypothetical protein JXM69_04335 [Anaerolineae bacterium]|nr:hypothetical protein [Anaerolineae bacterium]
MLSGLRNQLGAIGHLYATLRYIGGSHTLLLATPEPLTRAKLGKYFRLRPITRP